MRSGSSVPPLWASASRTSSATVTVSLPRSAVVTVTYAVAGVAAGTTDTLLFTARPVAAPSATDTGRLELTVIRPNLTNAKTVTPSGTQLPGADLTYTITFTNDGSEDAVDAVVIDSLPSEVQFKVGTATSTVPLGIGVTLEYSNDGGTVWTYTPISAGCASTPTTTRSTSPTTRIGTSPASRWCRWASPFAPCALAALLRSR